MEAVESSDGSSYLAVALGGVGTATSLASSKVIDIEILSKY